MDAVHHFLIFHTNIQWLNTENVTERIFEFEMSSDYFFEVQRNFLPISFAIKIINIKNFVLI